MDKEFYYIYQYLEKEGFSIDLDEFELQIQAHPAYPSLLSIIDTLSFFNIENGAFHIDLSRIQLLPNRFIAMLNSRYFVIEEKDENYTCYSDKKKNKISKKELESRWNGIVILIEKPDTEEGMKQKKNYWNLIYFIISLGKSKVNKGTYNYKAFKDSLLASNTHQDNLLQSSTIKLGNPDASLKIIMVINPFSNYCKKRYFIIEEILQKHFDKVCFDIRFNFNENDYGIKKSKKIHQHLVAAYINFGQEGFRKALINWFKNNDEKKLYATQISQSNELKINEILKMQFNSNLENNIIFTPTVVIDKYIILKQYDLKELSGFIQELSEDEDIIKRKN